ncbi:MAG: hypothetical protein JNL57_04715 [Bacteroidetes bacterium]|nr:hypothetical protein [Bacteroidota bacterium]
MASDNINHRFVIAEYRWKYILYAVVCWSLVLAGLLTFSVPSRNWQFWMAETVMTAFAMGLTYMLANRKYRFIGRKGPDFDAYMQERYESMRQDTGSFVYVSDGFEFTPEVGNVIRVEWSRIRRISAHVEDVVTNDDDIAIKLEWTEGHFFEVNEEINGWLRFVEELQKAFPQIPDDWQQQVLRSNARELELFAA